MGVGWRMLVVATLAIMLAVGILAEEQGKNRPKEEEEDAPRKAAVRHVDDEGEKKKDTGWRQLLARRLPVYGHRNWIVVADAAYPAQSKPGIETVATGAEQLEVVEEVLAALDRGKHVRPNVYLDAELPSVEDRDARGIARYRQQLRKLLGRRPVQSLPHERIIERLDGAANRFHVLILKTNLALPYTSVFLELDCGYWSDAAEKRLRKALEKPEEKP